jgi:CHC2 zinc finger
MIDDQQVKSLLELYFIIRDTPAWLGYCVDAELTQEELEYLEKCADKFQAYQPEKEANKAFDFIDKEGGLDIYECESNDEKIKLLTKKINELWNDLDEAHSKGFAPLDLIVKRNMSQLKQWEKIRNSLRSHEIFSPIMRGTLSEQEILKARETPLNMVVGDDKRIPCPFHNGTDKNFSIHGRYGHCFVCGEWCDAIKWLMRIEGKSFVEAVMILN